MLSLLKVWYVYENAIVRPKLFNSTLKRITPWLTMIIQQGIEEGVFNTRYPEHICRMNVYLLQGLSDGFIEFLLIDNTDKSQVIRAKQIPAAYTDALEKILGAPNGSIRLMEDGTLEQWFS